MNWCQIKISTGLLCFRWHRILCGSTLTLRLNVRPCVEATDNYNPNGLRHECSYYVGRGGGAILVDLLLTIVVPERPTVCIMVLCRDENLSSINPRDKLFDSIIFNQTVEVKSRSASSVHRGRRRYVLLACVLSIRRAYSDSET